MSTLKTDLIQNRAGTRPPGVTAGDFLKSWGRVAGDGSAIAGSLGVSSVGDTAVGRAAINLSVPFSSTAVEGCVSGVDAAGQYYMVMPYIFAVSQIALACNDANGTLTPRDPVPAYLFTIFGVQS